MNRSVGLDGGAVAAHFEMQMRTGRHAGRADFADILSLLDRLTLVHEASGTVPVESGDASAVI